VTRKQEADKWGDPLLGVVGRARGAVTNVRPGVYGKDLRRATRQARACGRRLCPSRGSARSGGKSPKKSDGELDPTLGRLEISGWPRANEPIYEGSAQHFLWSRGRCLPIPHTQGRTGIPNREGRISTISRIPPHSQAPPSPLKFFGVRQPESGTEQSVPGSKARCVFGRPEEGENRKSALQSSADFQPTR